MRSSGNSRRRRQRVTVVDYPDGRLAIRYRGLDLPYTTFDKLRQVSQASIVENKHLGAVLSHISRQVVAARNLPDRTIRRLKLFTAKGAVEAKPAYTRAHELAAGRDHAQNGQSLRDKPIAPPHAAPPSALDRPHVRCCRQPSGMGEQFGLALDEISKMLFQRRRDARVQFLAPAAQQGAVGGVLHQSEMLALR